MPKNGGHGQVGLVSMSRATLDALRDFLRSAGIVALGTTQMADCWELEASITRAVVVFPDPYPRSLVDLAVAKLVRRRPRMRLVLVSSHPQAFRPLVERASDAQLISFPVMGGALLRALGLSTSSTVASSLSLSREGAVVPKREFTG